MKQNNASAYVVVAIALVGLLYMVASLKSFDVGTQDHPHVISLHK